MVRFLFNYISFKKRKKDYIYLHNCKLIAILPKAKMQLKVGKNQF